MSEREEIQAIFDEIQVSLKTGTAAMAQYVVSRQEAVITAQLLGNDWKSVLKQALINIKLMIANTVVEQSDKTDQLLWNAFWRAFSAAITAMIAKI